MLASASKTRRVVVVHQAVRRSGFGAEIAAFLSEELFGTLQAGDVLYRLETDKVETDCEATASGVVRHKVDPGEVYAVGTVIGEIEG